MCSQSILLFKESMLTRLLVNLELSSLNFKLSEDRHYACIIDFISALSTVS